MSLSIILNKQSAEMTAKCREKNRHEQCLVLHGFDRKSIIRNAVLTYRYLELSNDGK